MSSVKLRWERFEVQRRHSNNLPFQSLSVLMMRDFLLLMRPLRDEGYHTHKISAGSGYDSKIDERRCFIDRVTDSIAILLLKSKLSHFCMHSCTTVNHRILCPTSKLAFLFPKEKVSTSKACFFSTFFLEKKTRCRSKFFAAAAGESKSSRYKKIERQPSPEW